MLTLVIIVCVNGCSEAKDRNKETEKLKNERIE